MTLSLTSQTMMVMLFPYAFICVKNGYFCLATLSFFSFIVLIVGTFGYCRQQAR